jgi:hypothetical protein
MAAAAHASNGEGRSQAVGGPHGDAFAGAGLRPMLPPPARAVYKAKPRPARGGGVADPTRITLRGQPRWWKLISHPGDRGWQSGLSFDMPHIPVFFRLAAVLTVVTVAALAAWLVPGMGVYEWRMPALALCGLAALTCLGYVCRYLDAVVLVASQGKHYEPSIDGDPLRAVLSGGRWLGRFLAGPAALAGAGVGYWIYCGELTIVDGVILTEIAIAAAGWWLIALLVAAVRPACGELSRAGSWLPAPHVVLRTAQAMKWDTARLTLLATVVVVGHSLAGWFSISWVHEHFFAGIALMFVIWSSCLYFSAFAFRRLGLAFYRMEQLRAGDDRGMGASVGKPEMPRCWVPAPQWENEERATSVPGA